MVTVDTSFLVSFLLKSDVFHNKSIELFEKLLEENEIIVVNNFVISELITLANIKYSDYKQSFTLFIKEFLNTNKFYFVHYIDQSEFASILDISLSNDISFTDNSVILTSLKYKNPQLISYDKNQLKIFEQYKNDILNQKSFLVEDKNSKKYSARKRHKKL